MPEENQGKASPEDIKKAQKFFWSILGVLAVVILLAGFLFVPAEKRMAFFVAASASLYLLVNTVVFLMVYGLIALFITIFTVWIAGAQGHDLLKGSGWKVLVIFLFWPVWLVYLFFRYSPVILPAIIKVLKEEYGKKPPQDGEK